MSGQLVIAELQAFRAVLARAVLARSVLAGATPPFGETIKLWSRSTITNALHRVGPTDSMTAAAERAWSEADRFADELDGDAGPTEAKQRAREQALAALDALIAVVRATKVAHPIGIGDSIV